MATDSSQSTGIRWEPAGSDKFKGTPTHEGFQHTAFAVVENEYNGWDATYKTDYIMWDEQMILVNCPTADIAKLSCEEWLAAQGEPGEAEIQPAYFLDVDGGEVGRNEVGAWHYQDRSGNMWHIDPTADFILHTLLNCYLSSNCNIEKAILLDEINQKIEWFIQSKVTRLTANEKADAHIHSEHVKKGQYHSLEHLSLGQVANLCHYLNDTWWRDPATGNRIVRNRAEQQMMIVTEIAEMTEGTRKGLNDDKLPHRKMEEVEAADALIRLLDYTKGHGLDIVGALYEKLNYNVSREDHKPENRVKDGGKKF